MVDDLLGNVADAGFVVELTDGGPQLVRIRRGAEMPAELLADLTANRDAVVAHMRRAWQDEVETCRVCGRETDAEDRAVVATNALLCDRGGSRGYTDGDGFRHGPTERCPYKRQGGGS